MSKIVTPPVLISKVLTFVLAGAIVVLATLVFTLVKMIPLERPEVFFLLTPTRSSDIVIIPMKPDADNAQRLDFYKRGFIREYVIARNTLYAGTNAYLTRNNWSNVVKLWSSDKVFNDMTKTSIYQDYIFNAIPPTVSCSVNFENANNERAVKEMRDGIYEVNFVWVCEDENIGGQTTLKNYKIQVRIDSELQSKISGTPENLEKLRKNPLGIQVIEYVVKDGKDDPLDSDTKSW